MITKKDIHKGFVGNKRGWVFSIYFNDSNSPQIQSALFKTKQEAQAELQRYIDTGKFAAYGSAETETDMECLDRLNIPLI